MKNAWIENNQVRDSVNGNPQSIFHPDIAALYTVEIPDDIENGATQIDGQWVNPEKPVYQPEPKSWRVDEIRKCLSLRERVKWDNDSSETIKTAKIEIGFGIKREPLLELLELLVEVGDMSQATADKIIALEPVEIE